eukprot:gnl/MRDRNA2_/MRDRNA2_228994_c0_seq1.p1 gnl/MRDRNA2_/MRDRNA2_228994_c0~~gnl/MRDRNA2_/MRDRNA2_228994_c0_seq1.p1  ORF type:complete len:463 (+),score=46.57 gnl/MRDRNA2_/MRDRNA2_228994_c0_seq1:45-1391(+)
MPPESQTDPPVHDSTAQEMKKKLHMAYLQHSADRNPTTIEFVWHFLYYGITCLELWATLDVLWLCTRNMGLRFASLYCASGDRSERFQEYDRRMEMKLEELANTERVAGDNCWKHVYDQLRNCTAYNVVYMDQKCFRETLPSLKSAHETTIAFTVIVVVTMTYHFYRNRFPFGTIQYYQLMVYQRSSIVFKFVLFLGFCCIVCVISVTEQFGETVFVAIMCASAAIHLKNLVPNSHQVTPGLSKQYLVMLRTVPPWHNAHSNELELLSKFGTAEEIVKHGLKEFALDLGYEVHNIGKNQKNRKMSFKQHLQHKITKGKVSLVAKSCNEHILELFGEGKKRSFSAQLVAPITYLDNPHIVMGKLMSAYLQYTGSNHYEVVDFQTILEHPVEAAVIISAFKAEDHLVDRHNEEEQEEHHRQLTMQKSREVIETFKHNKLLLALESMKSRF